MNKDIEYEIPEFYRDFSRRILRFARTHFWMYIPDAIIIIFLLIPPYSTSETIALISGLVVLGFRDIFIMRRMKFYLFSFKVQESMVYYTVHKYNQVMIDRSTHISNVDIKISQRWYGFSIGIYENDLLVHQQYAMGYWTKQRLRELYNRFNSLKGGVNLKAMFKEQL
jgi:hypothetical protein